MRKCPNCKKPVPIGARRCVYCRAVLSEVANDTAESDDLNTRMGFGGAAKSLNTDDINGSTAFGRPGASGANSSDNRGMMGRNNNMTHHTMLGLGPISSSSARDEILSGNLGGVNQRTIAGMPGVSFDTQRANSGYRISNVQPSQNRDSEFSAQNTIRQSSSHNEGLRPISQQQSPVAQAQRFEQPAANQFSEQPIRRSQPVAAPTPAHAPAEDPLAGMAGVAPMPSSLVDEEVVDLTSKLFGDAFAAVKDDNDEDEDGLDFDMPAAPAPKPAATPKPATKFNPLIFMFLFLNSLIVSFAFVPRVLASRTIRAAISIHVW